jgi:malonyl-CoA O-methyltransferase
MSRINKDLVRQRFGRRLHDYRDHAIVQERMAARLAELTAALCQGRTLNRVLEIGSGSAGLTEALLSRLRVASYFANDLVPESEDLVSAVARKHRMDASIFLPGDIERIDIPRELDLIVSGATVQWLTDLPDFFRRTAAALSDGALLCFSTFGPDNMAEIRQLTSVGLHYPGAEELRRLVEPRFDIERIADERHEILFPSPEMVLRHVGKTGVNGLDRNPWTRTRHRAFVDDYRLRFAAEKGVRLTYHCLYCCLRKKSQPLAKHHRDRRDKPDGAAMERVHGW